MNYFALSFDHMDTVNGCRLQVSRFVPVTITQALVGMVIVTEIPTAKAGEVIKLPVIGKPEPLYLTVVGDNRFRDMTQAEVRGHLEKVNAC